MQRHCLTRSMRVMAVALVVSLSVFVPVLLSAGQDGGTAATSAEPPARSLTGVWMRRTPPGVFESGATFTKEPPALTQWGLERFKANRPNNSGQFRLDATNDPVLTKCHPPGVPRIYFHPYPFEILETPTSLLQIFEYDHWLRRFWTDGRAVPADPDFIWMGTSVGRWLDDHTFEVVSVGFNEGTWLDRSGYPHSEQLKVTERFRRVALDRLELDFIMEDPVALARPWTATFYYQLRPDWELGEISCSGDYLDWAEVEK